MRAPAPPPPLEKACTGPTEVTVALCTPHVRATTVLLNPLSASRASFRRLLDLAHSLVLLLQTSFGADLELRAGFADMVRSIAGDTGSCATGVAAEDVRFGWTRVLGVLVDDDWILLLAPLRRLGRWFRGCLLLLLLLEQQRSMYLSSFAASIQAPAPAWSCVTDELALELDEPGLVCQHIISLSS